MGVGKSWRAAVGGLVAFAAVTAVTEVRAAEQLAPIPAKCQVPYDLLGDDSRLMRASKKLIGEQALKIVALGSSSTLGLGATSPAKAYPTRLEAELSAAFPTARIQVVNKGMSRQSAQQMLARLDSDVLAERPALVIWETGTAEAVRSAEVDLFLQALIAGVDRMLAAGIDVIVMDTQYSRSTAQLINFPPYVAIIDRVANARDLILFPRYAIMRYWVENDHFSFADKPPAEARKVADDVYGCISVLLARTIQKGLKRPS